MNTPPSSQMRGLAGPGGKVAFKTPSRPPSYYSTKSFKSFRSTPGISAGTTEHDTKQAGEMLDFLTVNSSKQSDSHRRNSYDEAVFQSEFEHLTALCLLNVKDPELMRLLKECGWTGNRFTSAAGRWDVDFIIQALSNYYLKCTNITTMMGSVNNNYSLQSSTGRHRSAYDNISPFCPDIVIDALRTRPLIQPFSHAIKGACMLADISGFSAYSGQMCSRGVTGLDELRSVTNGLLGHFVHTVYEFGGDVIAFAGDALICIFHDKLDESGRPVLQANCCVRALVCASLLCKDQSHHLSTHVAVSYGNMSLALLGGAHDQWISLLTGDCINDLADCITKAGAKQVAANAACTEMLKNDTMADDLLRTTACDETNSTFLITLATDNHEMLREILEPEPGPSLLSRQHAADGDIVTLEEDIMHMPALSAEGSSKKLEERNIATQLIKFVPKPVKHALRGDILDSIGELRQVTTVFLSLDSFDKNIEGKDPLMLQTFFSAAQKHLHESGGFLRQFLVDDKGCVLIAMWGVPSFSYANNCSRALYFAVALQHSVLELQHKCSIGITTGMVFCGIVGAEARKDYVGIGTDVNIAARLMGKAHGRILADSTTFQNSNPPTRELLVPAEKLQLKGMSEPVVPYTYDSLQLPPLTEADHLDSTYLLQKRVTSTIDAHLDNISNAEVDIGVTGDDIVDLPKSALFVLGPAGSGKSTANNYFRQGAQKRGMKSILLQIQSFHKGVPYSVVRMLLMELISAGEAQNSMDAQRKLLKRLITTGFPHYTDSEVESAYSSLERVLGRTWQSDTSFFVRPRKSSTEEDYKEDDYLHTRRHSSNNNLVEGEEKSGPNRVETRKSGETVLCKVLMLLLYHGGPYAIILENGHLCDELSWKLVNALFSERNMQLLLMVTVLVKVNVAKKEGTLYKQDMKNRRGVANGASNVDVDEILDNISKTSTGTMGDVTERAPDSENLLRISTDLTEMIPFGPPVSEPSSVLNITLRSRITRKLESELPAGCLALMSRKFSDILELGGLNNSEVKEILTASLRVDTVSDSLVQMVMDVSSGNPFWCTTIANFIKDRGLSELEEARKKSDTDSQSILKMLVVCRLDHLTVDELIVLKHASIIGYDFTYKLLQSIVPHKVYKNLDKYTGILVEQGFIRCFEEVPELRFCFANQVFQTTLYNLTLPTDAALVHLAIAECLEVSNTDNLQPFYPILGQHYKRCGASYRNMAFKFELKSADQAIAQGAFGEGLEFAKSSFLLAENRPELSILLDVLTAGLEDMSYNRSPSPLSPKASMATSMYASAGSGGDTPTTPVTPTSTRSINSRRISMGFGGGDKLTKDYNALKQNVEKAIANKHKFERQGIIKSDSSSSEAERKKFLNENRSASTSLTWQASYTKKKRDEKRTNSGQIQQPTSWYRSFYASSNESSGTVEQPGDPGADPHPPGACCTIA